MISGENIPTNKEEMKRLKDFEELHKLDNQRKSKRIPEKKVGAKEVTDELGETQQLLNEAPSQPDAAKPEPQTRRRGRAALR